MRILTDTVCRSAGATERNAGEHDAAKCTLYPGTDVTGGNDLGTASATSAEDCLTKCQADCRCSVAVWGQTSPGHHNCYLKYAGRVKAIGGKPANAAINCTNRPSCPVPPSPKPPAPNPPPPHYVWKTTLPQGTPQINGLLVDGVRAIRARYPNANPEVDKFPIGYISSVNEWLPPRDYGPIKVR